MNEETQPINDELMMPCAQCCRKHLSAAIAHWADAAGLGDKEDYWRMLFARALINLAEAEQGYESHRPFAIGLITRAEVACAHRYEREELRTFRLLVTEGGYPTVPFQPSAKDWYRAHVHEAEREFPDIRTAVERDQFYRDNMSEPELRQAEVNYRLAQLRWLDENVFGTSVPKEKGEEEMAKAVKKPAPAKKGGCKGACKGGKCKK